MAATLNRASDIDLIEKIKIVTEICKISNLENMIYNFFDSLSDDNPVNYVGELNKNDVMH